MKAIIMEDTRQQAAMVLTGAGLAKEIQVISNFQDPDDIMIHTARRDVDLVLMDVSFMGVKAFQLGEQLLSRCPDIVLVYITDDGNRGAVMEYIKTQGATYIMKPIKASDLEYAIEIARTMKRTREKRIFAKTLGNFDLFIDGKPVIFKSSKAKELLALLVDRRGGIVTSEQAIGTLWEYRTNDEASRSLYSKVGKSLNKTLEEAGAEGLVITSRGMKSIDVEKLDCDLYRLLEGDEKTKKNYFGRYMQDYSWAEYRVPVLDKLCGLVNS